MFRWILIFCSAAVFAPLFGHMDPPGEVHPTVVVVGDEFRVYFADISERPTEGRHGYFRVYSQEGSSKGGRREAGEEVLNQIYREPELGLPEELTGRWRTFLNAFYIFPEWRRKHEGRPFYLIANEERHIRKELQWPVPNVDIVEDFVVTDSDLALLVTREIEGGRGKTDLWLCHFDRRSGDLIRESRIGSPSFIYSFPGVSRLIQRDDGVFFVWNESIGSGECLHLARYDLQEHTLSDRPLTFPSTWNIHISIEAIGDVLCVAYHGVKRELSVEFIRLSEIFTLAGRSEGPKADPN
ncbi:MAG TPA: hypothetical protein VIK52_03315 [Opitutaceae bacterium]